MREKILKISLGCIFILVCAPTMAFDYHSYNEMPFDKVISTHENDFEKYIDNGISAYTFKYKSKVKFTNMFRALTKSRKLFLRQWVKALGQPKEFIEQYKSEFLVKNGSYEIWVPMQAQVIPYMNKELMKDQEFYLYYVYLGAKKGELVFLGTEFKIK